ncbi:MAG: PqqD family protein [Waterburya sp.]
MVIKQVAEAIIDDLDGGTVVYKPSNGAFFQLNSSGRYIWDSLSDWLSLEQLAINFSAKYQIPKEVAEADLKTFLSGLFSRGLLEQKEASRA